MRRVRRVTLVSAMTLGAAAASASWVHIPITTIVAESDLAIVGVLSDVHARKENPSGPWDCAEVLNEGTITVDEVVFGAADFGQTLLLKWVDGCGGLPLNHNEHVDRPTVWFLKKAEDGSVYADYPWRVIRLCESDLKTVRRVLAELGPTPHDKELDRLASVVWRPPAYKCEHHLWDKNR